MGCAVGGLPPSAALLLQGRFFPSGFRRVVLLSLLLGEKAFDQRPAEGDDDQDSKKGPNRHFWAKGYFVSTVGINKEVIREYIKHQEEADIIGDKVNS